MKFSYFFSLFLWWIRLTEFCMLNHSCIPGMIFDHAEWYFNVFLDCLQEFYWLFLNLWPRRKLFRNSPSLLSIFVVWYHSNCSIRKWIWQCSFCFDFMKSNAWVMLENLLWQSGRIVHQNHLAMGLLWLKENYSFILIF